MTLLVYASISGTSTSELVFADDDKARLLYCVVTRALANDLTTNEFQ
jgi:hypothetical protein